MQILVGLAVKMYQLLCSYYEDLSSFSEKIFVLRLKTIKLSIILME